MSHPPADADVLGLYGPSKRGRIEVRATRPAVVDLRFREDAWVVAGEGHATIRLGDYRLSGIAVTSFDIPALNRLFFAVRIGQARRQVAAKPRKGQCG